MKVPFLEGKAWRRAGNKCEECGFDAEAYMHPKTGKEWANRGRCPLEIHHIRPISEGGKSTLDNLRLLCVECHRKQTLALKQKLAAAHRRPKLIAILQALTERNAIGATTAQLCALLNRSTTPLLADLKRLRNKGYIERDKRNFYYITVLGRAKLEGISHENKI